MSKDPTCRCCNAPHSLNYAVGEGKKCRFSDYVYTRNRGTEEISRESDCQTTWKELPQWEVSPAGSRKCTEHNCVFVWDESFKISRFSGLFKKGRWLRFSPNHEFDKYPFPAARRLGQLEEQESPSPLGIGLLSSAILAGGYF